MIQRRFLLTATASGVAARPFAAWADGFDAFVAGVKAEARRSGVSDATLARAFAGVRPNAHILELDSHQPEFTLTWAEYRAKVVNDNRIATGRQVYARDRQLLAAVYDRYGVDAGVVMGIWGLESNFGATKGNYGVIEALATLAYAGRRPGYFRGELIAALKILDNGDITPERMLGSYAGAMGQPQFMPSSYLRLAVDFDGRGRRDIWDDQADALGSIANYLAKSGWRSGEPWGQPVSVPPGFDPGYAGRDSRRTLGEWMRLGVRRQDGTPFARSDVAGALVMPGAAGGEAFMTYANFGAIRRYNASDYYALSVGLIGDRILA
ncbi:MAG TPA: lytic murein transglycosylase [Acidisphaera sp.]|nr:lytic murein transglycosylase [Acidisphaera sp.]